MNKKQTIIILLTILPIFFLGMYIGYYAKKKETPLIQYKETTQIKIDTITTNQTIYKPQPIYIKYDTSNSKQIDTFKIIENFLAVKKYEIKHNDTNGKAEIQIFISKNELDSTKYKIETYNKTKTITKEIIKTEQPKWGITLGTMFLAQPKKIGAAAIIGTSYKKHEIAAFYDPFNNQGGLYYTYKIWNK